MTNLFKASLGCALCALLVLPATPAEAQRKRSSSTAAKPSDNPELDAMIAKRKADAEAKAPWYFKTPHLGRFRATTNKATIAEEEFARSGLGWALISNALTDQKGMFPNYTVFLGITPDGKFEGVLFPSGSSKIFGEEMTSRKLDDVSSLEIQMADGERAGMQLSDVKVAKFDQTFRGKTSEQTVWYKTFTPGGKAWRMLGGLPDDSGLTLHYATSEGPGQLKYRVSSDEEPLIFKIGYLKEMMNGVREVNQSK